jgi:hypothetical protein
MVIGALSKRRGRGVGGRPRDARPLVELRTQDEQHDQEARHRQRRVIPDVGERDRFHQVAAEVLHELDAEPEHKPAEEQDRGVDPERHQGSWPATKTLQEIVEGDVVFEIDADRTAQERDPDQQVARHLLRPGQHPVEAVAADHGEHDDREDRRGLEQDHNPHDRPDRIDDTVEGLHGTPGPQARDKQRAGPIRTSPWCRETVLG